MKTGLFILSFLLVISTFAQNSKPTELKLVGSHFSYAKGNIDVEVLTEIIQQKQDKVFIDNNHWFVSGWETKNPRNNDENKLPPNQ